MKKSPTLPGASFEEDLEVELKNPRFRRAYMARRAMHEIARAVAAARESRSLSQEELAERLHTAQSVISRLESGRDKRMPRLDTLAGIAEALDMRLRLVFEKAPKKRKSGRTTDVLSIEFPPHLIEATRTI